MNGATPQRDALDDNVPVLVLEFLLGKYCASSDEVAIQMGLQVVNDTLANNYIRSDELMKAQAMVKDAGADVEEGPLVLDGDDGVATPIRDHVDPIFFGEQTAAMKMLGG